LRLRLERVVGEATAVGERALRLRLERVVGEATAVGERALRLRLERAVGEATAVGDLFFLAERTAAITLLALAVPFLRRPPALRTGEVRLALESEVGESNLTILFT